MSLYDRPYSWCHTNSRVEVQGAKGNVRGHRRQCPGSLCHQWTPRGSRRHSWEMSKLSSPICFSLPPDCV